jgi:hypothetical protein
VPHGSLYVSSFLSRAESDSGDLQIRRLIAACIVRLYAVGDTLPLYGRISDMQAYLGSREALARSTPETARVGVLQCLAALCAVHGQKVISTMPESLALGVKHAAKYGLADL